MCKRFVYWLLLASCCMFLPTLGIGQNWENKVKNYNPVSPTAHEFKKNLDIPVTEYNGLANISVPLYSVDLDGVSVPISLSYHSAGIGVSQEASWVGLGWDMQFGKIVQEINDRDDYGQGNVFLRPDWNESPVPSNYSQKYINMWTGILNPGYNDIVPVEAPKPFHSYRIYSAYPVSVTVPGSYFFQGVVDHNWYIPINGNRDLQPQATYMVNDLNYDSEPDIFTASFLGHNLKFIKNPANNSFVVLNRKGYKISRVGETFLVVDPSGVEFHFAINIPLESYSVSINGLGNAGPSSTQTEVTSREWVLTKIVTANKREIFFNYQVSATQFDNYPSYSEKAIYILSSSSQQISTGEHIGFPYQATAGVGQNFNYSKSKRAYLSSISFPGGVVEFTLADRDDMLGAKKLELIQVKYGTQIIYSFDLDFTYFDAFTIGGNGFTPTNASVLGNTRNLRLKLLSVKNQANEKHQFYYNTTNLPAKNSFAQDYWGFYNGQLSNTSLIPNPSRLNSSQLGIATGLPDNGNNHSANLSYTKAGVLESVQFPTGGKVVLEYELNQFDNYWAPDFTSTSNTITNGNGLRIKSLSYHANVNEFSKKTVFEYSGGIAASNLKFCRTFLFSSLQLGSIPSFTSRDIAEINAKGYYVSNSLGSGNGVGYSTVVRKEVNQSGASLGRIESDYRNIQDITSTGATTAFLNVSLPSRKYINNYLSGTYNNMPSNGSLLEQRIYNNLSGTPIKKSEYTYLTDLSEIHYGARIFNYSLVYWNSPNGWISSPKSLVGYYPIYDLDSRVSTVKVTDVDQNSIAHINETTYYYDSYGLLKEELKKNSTNLEQIRYYRPHDNLSLPVHTAMFTANRLTDIVRVERYKRDLNYNFPRLLNLLEREYIVQGNLFLEKKVTTRANQNDISQPLLTEFISFDLFGNPREVNHTGIVSSMIWDYDGRFVTASVRNASASEIAFTSFESSGTGNWSIIGSATDDPSAITGKKVLILNGGNSISRSGLASNKEYLLSYWTKNATPYAITGTMAGYPRAGRTEGAWRYFEHKISGQTSMTIAGTGVIDEVRLYPFGAMMNTATFDPLVGLLDQCDQNNRIVYYEYYNDKRLKLVRDQNRNILKMYCYNLWGEQENCPALCTNTTADWQNTSSPLRCQVNSSQQNTGFQEQEQRDVNPCSPTYNQLQWVVSGYNTTACPLPSNCNTQNCTGNNKKCINGVCETGTLVVVSSELIGKGQWLCTKRYCFSDGSYSTYYETTSGSSPCMVLICGN